MDIFLELRDRHGFNLGVDDYLLLLEALSQGLEELQRRQFVFLAQCLWAKSRQEARRLGELLSARLPAEFTESDLDRLLAETRKLETDIPGGDQLPTDTDTPPVQTLAGKEEEAERPLTTIPRGDGIGRPGSAPPQNAAQTTPVDSAGTVVTEVKATAPSTGSSPLLAVPSSHYASFPIEIDPNVDTVGMLPVTHRETHQAFRHFRRIKRVGPRVEVDLSATLEQYHRQGVFCGPVLIPARRNLARLLLLIDASPSMVPFRRIIHSLLEAVAECGFAYCRTLFFSNIPYRFYSSPQLAGATLGDDALRELDDGSVLIVSDAGAARGRADKGRKQATMEALAMLQRHRVTNIGWLNPMPRQRWVGNSAEAIADSPLVTMNPLDKGELYLLVGALRGRQR